jgi:hypothetical protein
MVPSTNNGIMPRSRIRGAPISRTRAVLIAGAFAIDIDEVDASPGIGPAARHALYCRAGYIEDRQYDARHLRRIELVHDGLYRAHRANFITMHTAHQRDALARFRPLGDHHGYIPVLARGHLHALKIEGVFPTGVQIRDVECADDLFAADQVPSVSRSSWRRRSCLVLRISSPCGCREGCRGANRGKGCDHEITAIEATRCVILHGGGSFCDAERRDGEHSGA